MSIEFILIGFIVGGLVGMTGVGGASLLTPLLIFLGIQPSIAIGTDFAYNSITKVAGVIQHTKQKTVDFQLVKYLAIGSIPAGALANVLFYFFLSDYYNEAFVTRLLGFILIGISIITFILLVFGGEPGNQWKQKTVEEKRLITITSGAVIGAIVGITSIGAGSLFAIFILYFFKINAPRLVGTDITHAFLLTTIVGFIMAGHGHIDYSLVGNLLCGSIPGAIVGSRLTTKIPSKVIRMLIVIIILVSGIKLVL